MNMEDSPDDMSVLLQFAKFSRGFRINDFVEFVEKDIGVEKLDFFGRLAYPNQWQIRLTDRKIREKLILKGRTRINNRSCWIYPLDKQEIRGFVHWLPNSVTNDQLKEYLQQYGKVLFVESQKRPINGKHIEIESDHRYYGLILQHGTIKEDLPHFLKINGFMCLVVVRGREPACYHCKEVGHRRAECPKYKAKLISYCNREPNTAPPRLRPRGRRHEKAKTEAGAETGRSEVSSIGDILGLERIPFAELTTEPRLPALEDHQHDIEAHREATGSTEKNFEESNIVAQRGASFSETQTADILEKIKNLQRRAAEKMQQDLKNLQMEISMVIPRRSHSTHITDQKQSTITEATCENLELEMENVGMEMQAMKIYASEESSSPVEMGESDSNVGMDIKETKGVEIRPELPTMLQAKADSAENVEEMSEKSEESPYDLQSIESAAKASESNADAISHALLMLKDAKQTASETIENTRKKLQEFILSINAPEEPSKDSATDTVPKLTGEDGQELLNMLKNLKVITTEHSSFKKIEANLYSHLSGKSIDSEVKLPEEDINFARQTLENAKESTTEVLQNAFKRLEEKVVEKMKQSETATESAFEGGATPKIANIITQPDATFEQPKQDTDAVMHICQESVNATMVNVSEILQNTFKNLEEKVVKMAKQSQTTTESATETGAIPKIAGNVTQPDSTFEQRKRKILDAMRREGEGKSEAAKENERLLVASKNQEEKVVELAEPSETATEIATESEDTLKIANIATQPDATLQQQKQHIIDPVQPICEKDIEVVETESSEITSRRGKTPEESFETESDSVTIDQEHLKPTEICEPSEGSEVATTKGAFAERERADSTISKAVQEDLDKLQTNLKTILASFQDKTVHSETITILKQVESEVAEVVEETKNKWKKEH